MFFLAVAQASFDKLRTGLACVSLGVSPILVLFQERAINCATTNAPPAHFSRREKLSVFISQFYQNETAKKRARFLLRSSSYEGQENREFQRQF